MTQKYVKRAVRAVYAPNEQTIAQEPCIQLVTGNRAKLKVLTGCIVMIIIRNCGVSLLNCKYEVAEVARRTYHKS